MINQINNKEFVKEEEKIVVPNYLDYDMVIRAMSYVRTWTTTTYPTTAYTIHTINGTTATIRTD